MRNNLTSLRKEFLKQISESSNGSALKGSESSDSPKKSKDSLNVDVQRQKYDKDHRKIA